MSHLNECIAKCDDVLESGDDRAAKELVDDLIAEWVEFIPSVKKGLDRSKGRIIGDGVISCDNLGDIRKIRGKLRAYQEQSRDPEFGEIYSSIDEIERSLIASIFNYKEASDLTYQVVNGFNGIIPEVTAICIIDTEDGIRDALKTLRIKLQAYIDESRIKKERLVTSSAVHYHNDYSPTNSNTQTQTQTVNIEIEIEQVYRQIDAIDENELSKQDKYMLKGMIDTAKSTSGREAKGEVIKNILAFLADKTVDLVIACIPILGRMLTGV